MSIGYSVRVAEAINSSDATLLGVKLGQACLDANIPVAAVAKRLGVTRATVYNWFLGLTDPRNPVLRSKVERYLSALDVGGRE